MMRRGFLLGSAVLALVPLTACSISRDPFRYRLTVAIETPAGIKTGSSVIEVATSRTEGPFVTAEATGTKIAMRG